MRLSRARLAALACAALLAAGCGGKSSRRAAAGRTAAGGEASLRAGEFSATSALKAIAFAYDSAELEGAALAAVERNAARIKKRPDWVVLIEGHCDERGTIPYNLALGQKRARAVRERYIALGVPAEVLATLSYGKERPVCREASEACWRRNRRAENKIRVVSGADAR